MKRICHVTSVHKAEDTRIFHKECTSLAKNGYEVYLVSSGNSSQIKNGVNLVGCGDNNSGGRLNRMISFSRLVINKALELDCDVYHLHDPELLIYVDKIKRKNKKVIFDSHEDYSLFEKSYIPKWMWKYISKVYMMFEKKTAKKLDGLICCYQWTLDRLEQYTPLCKVIYNFPIIQDAPNRDMKNRKENNDFHIAYAGQISDLWSHEQLLDALSCFSEIKLELAGTANEEYLNKLKKNKNWKKVDYYGKITHEEVFTKIYKKANIGVALLDYIPECKGHIGNLANTKLFEFMMMGLPVICTDFEIWKNIIEEERCGLCVNPNKVNEISKAIDYLIKNQEESIRMGINGRTAVEKTYNWNNEEEKLLELYDLVLKKDDDDDD